MTTAPQPSTTQLVTAAAQAFLPLAGPYGIAASAALSAGLAFWSDFAGKMANGTLTMDDLEAAATKTDVDLTSFAAHVGALK
jgi:hypothetical protein